jgi:hypothetical protein
VLRICIEANIRNEEENDMADLDIWFDVLFEIGYRYFDNSWLELFYIVCTNRNPTRDTVSNTYQLLLKDFSFRDVEKLDQLE